MKNLFNSVLYVALFAFLLSCQKGTDSVSDQIIGKWDWVKSVSPWTGVVSNPLTTGSTSMVEFTHNGIMNGYRNDTLTSTTNYILEKSSTDSNKSILIYNSDIRVQISIDHDNLILNAAYVDGPVSYYIRSK
jgi:hypothetical protein